MTVNFKFECVLNLHNKNSYITYIEKESIDEENAFKRSLVQINKNDIKSISKTSDGYAVIIRKSINPPITTIESYDEIIDTLQKVNLAQDIMHKNKVYIFDDFEVDTDELNVCNGWDKLNDKNI
jgi:hypothetical protein